MTDPEKQTEHVRCVANEAIDELRKSSTECTVREAIESIDEGIKTAAERFNAMRAAFSEFITLMKGVNKETKDFVISTVAVRHGDYALLLDSQTDIPKHLFDVEDAGLFAELMRHIALRAKPETRIRACIEANDKITEAITGWQSKIDKMKLRSSHDGSSQAELDMATKKIVQFGEAIKILKKRGGQVSDAYFATVREMTDFLNDSKRKMKVIYWNESSGKERKSK